MRRVVRPLASLLLVAAGGCTADSPGDRVGADAAVGGPTADGGGSPRADAGPDGCLDQVPDDWGDNGPLSESQFEFEGDYLYYADMVPDTERFQRLFISLHPDMGVFAGGAVVPGTYVLEGMETDYAWCGACVYLAVDDDGSAPSVLYMAQTGKLTIDSVAGGEIHGTLESAELTQIDLAFSGPSCADYQEGDPWPCGNGACSGDNELCEEQELVPACTTQFDSFEF
jgi:hypothetical protein